MRTWCKLGVRTAPGHYYRNPPERVNCISNIGLYGIGVMRTRMFENPEFEQNLSVLKSKKFANSKNETHRLI